jgi:2-polyprenyl-3-methyl-5-hydroxy-6-metoxy-1,4-benzoquinol methylase
MSSTLHYSQCPVCQHHPLAEVFSAKDETVSQQYFKIQECPQCTLRLTQDVPNAASISDYYKSDTYISHTNTAKGFIHFLYKTVRTLTLRKKRKLVENITGIRQGNLLDVGAGTGAFVKEMRSAGWLVTGLEPDSDARLVAKNQFDTTLLPIDHLQQLTANTFDAITLWHVLEHVHDLNGYINTLKQLLATNGKLLVAVPNYTAKDAAIYQQHWAAYDVPRHLYHFSPQAMQQLMAKHGLKIVNHQPMWFDSFYICMLSSKYKNGKVNLVAAFLNGLKSNWQARKNAARCSSVIYVIAPL